MVAQWQYESLQGKMQTQKFSDYTVTLVCCKRNKNF